MFRMLAVAGGLVCASVVSAQVIYEPVQYQHQADGRLYYYGGTDARVHAHAQAPRDAAGRWGRAQGAAFISGDLVRHRAVRDEPTRVFTDAWPYRDARWMGFTADNAHNEALSRVPLYFRKADLLEAAEVRGGTRVVPFDAQPLPGGPPALDVSPVRTAPLPVLIFPRPSPSSKPRLLVAQSR